MRYNNLISPLTTLYENLWHQSMYYVSYMTLYEIQEYFSTSMENQNYTVLLILWIFCMILVWFLGNHIWSLYDYQELIQIIYDLVWLLRIICDLVRNQRKLYDRWPGVFFSHFRQISQFFKGLKLDWVLCKQCRLYKTPLYVCNFITITEQLTREIL